MTPQPTFEMAVQCHRAGRLAEAEQLYLQVLAADPNHADAAFLAGVLAMQAGRLGPAIEHFQQAVARAPDHPAYVANLGEAYRRAERFGDAMAALLKAMRLKPDLAEPVHNLGLLLHHFGEIDGAVACFERAAQLRPGEAAIARRLAAARKEQRKRRGGADLRAGSAEMLLELATLVKMQGRIDDAIALYRRILELRPKLASAHNNLGVALLDRSEMDEALACFRRALAIDESVPEVHCNVGNVLMRCGMQREGLDAYRRSIALAPNPGHHSNVVYAMAFDPRADARAILEEARAWERMYGTPPAPPAPFASHDRTPGRRLRLGYVGADFRNHCQGFFLHPLLRAHDRDQFEIRLYSNVYQPDGHTEAFRKLADAWVDVAPLDDAELARRVRADRVDVLVDLTMHMERGRLAAFALKPAPVQVAWLAYPGTTGVSAVDYRVTDRFLDPPGGGDVYAERSLVLPDTFWCYDPLASEPDVGPLPARAQGTVTFGCLNNFIKVTDAVVELWARVLAAVDGSRMIVLAPPGETRGRLARTFEQLGVARSRLSFVGIQPRADYLRTYQRIDVCLDTFPYNGHTTSLDAFWMGVPVVTLAGATVVGRAGVSQANNLGLTELVAAHPDDYVRIAAGLARDLERLGELRATLRPRMQASPLMDGPRFARHFEAALRGAWAAWCAVQARRSTAEAPA